jgi:hypothetical protein
MNKQGMITTTLGLGIVLLAVATFSLPQNQPASALLNGGAALGTQKSPLTTNPAGSNMTTGSNATGAAGNTTGGTHVSSIHTATPAGRIASCPKPCYPFLGGCKCS